MEMLCVFLKVGTERLNNLYTGGFMEMSSNIIGW